MCQQIKIKGKIINEINEPVAGAIITVKRAGKSYENSTPQPVLSDNNGEFSLTGLFYTDTLIITAEGYETLHEIFSENDRGYLLIELKRKLNAMEEVVINTGFQTIPRERATGSFSTVSKKLLDQQISTDILSRLEAVANSISIDNKTLSGGIMVRGLSTIKGPKAPLIILDNFPYEGDLTNINPNDVENITILKDAAAASIWGAKAGNGVIVITTRKARLHQKFSMELTTNYTILGQPDLYYQPQMSSSEFIDLEKFLFSQRYRFSDTAASAKPPFSPVYEILFKQRRGLLSSTETENLLNNYRSGDIRKDFKDLIYNNGLNQQYAINMQGGTSHLAWLISLGHDRNRSTLDDTYERYSLRFHNTYQPTSNITVTAAFTGTSIQSRTGKKGFNEEKTARGNFQPYLTLLNDQGIETGIYKDFRQTFLDTLGKGKLYDWKYYPLSDHLHDYLQSDNMHLLGLIGINATILKRFSLDVKYQYENQFSASDHLQDDQSYFTRNLVNFYSQINHSNQTITYRVPQGNILDKSSGKIIAHNIRSSINYSRDWLNSDIIILAGMEIRQSKSIGNSYRIFGYNPEILTIGRVDQVTTFPSIINGSRSLIPNINSLSGSINRFASFYSNAAYNWKNKYTVSASARRDASNLFGVNTNDKWNPFWSAGLSWKISSEDFWNWNTISFLKLRATYGFSGNIDPSKVAATTIRYNANLSSFTQSPYAQFDNYANPELRWERVSTMNFGIDFGSINNIISGTIEYYHKNGTDLFGPSPVDYTAGLRNNSIEKNVASMKAWGWDFEINSNNVRGKFEWSSHLNLSLYQDRVTEYYRETPNASFFLSDGLAITPYPGLPVVGVFSYKWAGLDPLTGDPLGYVDGQVSKDYTAISNGVLNDLIYNGTQLPKLFGSLGNTFSWKNIELTAALTYKFGYVFRRNSIHYGNLFTGSSLHSDYNQRWQNPGDEQFTQVPSMIYPAVSRRDGLYTNSEILIEKGDHIRLNYITLSYSLFRSYIPKLPFSHVRLYVNMSNAGILWRANNQGLDPDILGSSMPRPRNYAVGCKIFL